jgi:haloacetate dehalogenase
MNPVRQSLLLNELQLSYLEWDRGQQPLLLLHGLADHALVWSSLGDYLAQDYHIVAPDMRGHGDSTKPEEDYTFASAIADLESLMDCLGWENAHVVAHSWSGKLACIWARQNPQRIRSMVLVDPIFVWKMPSFLKLTFPLLFRVLSSLQGMGPFASYESAIAKARQLTQYQEWTPLQQQVFETGIEQKPDGSWGSKFTIAARDRIFEQVMLVSGLTTPVATPTLFVQPEKGVNRFDSQLKPYKKYLTNLRLCQIPGNHWLFLSAPDTFNQAVAEFLRREGVKE